MQARAEGGVRQQLTQMQMEGRLAGFIMSLIPESETERDKFVDDMILYLDRLHWAEL